MGTKNNPGKFDCYANANPDEPMFVLLGRDRHAALLVKLWAILRNREHEDNDVVDEAIQCALAMDKWRHEHGGKLIGDRPKYIESLLFAATEGMGDHPDDYDDSCDCDECRSCG